MSFLRRIPCFCATVVKYPNVARVPIDGERRSSSRYRREPSEHRRKYEKVKRGALYICRQYERQIPGTCLATKFALEVARFSHVLCTYHLFPPPLGRWADPQGFELLSISLLTGENKSSKSHPGGLNFGYNSYQKLLIICIESENCLSMYFINNFRFLT